MRWPSWLRRTGEHRPARFVLRSSPGGDPVPPMRADAPTPIRSRDRRPGPAPAVETTLLELVTVLCEVTEDDAEVVATVVDLVRAGRIRLAGTFRSREAELADDAERALARIRLPA